MRDLMPRRQPSRKNGHAHKPRVFATDQGVLRHYQTSLAKRHGAPVKLAATWKYDTFHVLRFDLPTPSGEKQRKEFRPVHQVPLGTDGAMGWQGGYPAGPRPIYRRKEVEAATPDLITIHGGEKATDAAASLGLVATTNAGGEKAIDKTDWTPVLRFATIIIVTDNDQAGEAFGQSLTSKILLMKPGADVRILRLPGLPAKGDIVEWVAAGGTLAEFLSHVDNTEPVTEEQVDGWKTTKTSDRVITVDFDEHRVVDDAIKAISTQDNVYQRGGGLVQIVRGAKTPKGIARPQDSPRIGSMRYARIRELLADAAIWLRQGKEDMERVHPPEWVVKAVDARGQWEGIPQLEAVVESPILRADGSVLQQAGYDQATGIVFAPNGDFPKVPEKPSRDDAVKAANFLLQAVEDFPFGKPVHRAAWLAGLVTPLARYAFHGPAPLFLHDANVRGCGKSLLTDVVAIVTTGRSMARMSLPRDDDEIRKRITALAIVGEPEILIDNVPNTLGSPSLDAALTATSWSDRILGQSAMASGIPLYATWYASGNNVVLVGDTARRVVHIRLESCEENPEERSGFRHPDLLAWVRFERPKLTAAAVTILAGYFGAGKPDQHLKAWGSYEAWSDVVRQAIVWVGLPDPADTRTELASQADQEALALRQLLTGWEEIDPGGHGVPISEVLRELSDKPAVYEGLHAALCELCPPKDGKTLNPRSIGAKLHHLRRRVVGGKYLDSRTTNRGLAWMVRSTSGNGGTGGSVQDSACTRTHAHAHENPQGAGNTTTSTSTTTCDHSDVEETPTSDGQYINRKCRLCGAALRCRKAST